MYYVYFLQSEKDGKLYVGMTSDVADRLASHNAGHLPSTKRRRPLRIIYQEEPPTLQAAVTRERYFKSLRGSREKREILKRCGVV